MKNLLFALTFIIPNILLADDCHELFKMTVYGHKRDEKYSVKLCNKPKREIVVKLNNQKRSISKKHIPKVLKSFNQVDLVTPIEQLEQNCLKKRDHVKAKVHMPNQDKKEICLFTKSPPLFNYRYFVKELLYSDAWK